MLYRCLHLPHSAVTLVIAACIVNSGSSSDWLASGSASRSTASFAAYLHCPKRGKTLGNFAARNRAYNFTPH